MAIIDSMSWHDEEAADRASARHHIDVFRAWARQRGLLMPDAPTDGDLLLVHLDSEGRRFAERYYQQWLIELDEAAQRDGQPAYLAAWPEAREQALLAWLDEALQVQRADTTTDEQEARHDAEGLQLTVVPLPDGLRLEILAAADVVVAGALVVQVDTDGDPLSVDRRPGPGPLAAGQGWNVDVASAAPGGFVQVLYGLADEPPDARQITMELPSV